MEAEPRLRAGDCLYLYGLVRRAAPFDGLAGVEGEPVSLVWFEELAAAVTPVPAEAYSDAGLRARAQEPEWIAARALRHEDVVRRLGLFGAVVPLKFGTLCATVAGVQDILRDHSKSLRALLNRFENRAEWGLKADLAEAPAMAALERSESDELDAAIAGASPGHAYLLRKKRSKRLAEAMERLAAGLAGDIYDRLRPAAADARRFAPWEAAPGRVPVLAAALLVDTGGLEALGTAAEAIEQRHREYGLRIELSGPWAPYSFCGQLGS